MSSFMQNHPYPGKLFVVEGIDGSGKSTQIQLLKKWLESKGYSVFFTEWNSSALVRETTKAGKKQKLLTPTTFSLLHATDFADRLENQIIPALEAGFVVLADRYIYTAFARDWMRGKDRQWIEDVFGFAIVPDLVCYLNIDIDNLIPRVIETGGMSYWESGCDLNLGEDLYENFRKYQSRMIKEFDGMVERFHFKVIDARAPVDTIQIALRNAIEPLLSSSTDYSSVEKTKTVLGGAPYKGPHSPLKAEALLPL